MASLLESGDLQDHIFNTLHLACARRYCRMMSATKEHKLPLGISLPQTNRDIVSGYCIWITLPLPLVADDLVYLAKQEEAVIIGSGPFFTVYGDADDGGLSENIRICF